MNTTRLINTPHYVIRLPNERLLCYPNSKQCIIYHHERDYKQLETDMYSIKGAVLERLDRRQYVEIFVGVNHTNEDRGVTASELREELKAIGSKGCHHMEDVTLP